MRTGFRLKGLEAVGRGENVQLTIEHRVVDTMRVAAGFSNMKTPFVGRRVLRESATRLAHLPTIGANP